MKEKWILSGLSFLLIILLATCGSDTAEQEHADAAVTPGVMDGETVEQEEAGAVENPDAMLTGSDLPLSSLLILGTFNLEETELAVDAEQAVELLSLWKAVRSMGSSDTTADAEMEALYKQIQDSMTVEQIQAIDDMSLEQESLRTVMAELGLGFGDGMGVKAPEDMAGMSQEELETRMAQRQAEKAQGGDSDGPGFGPPEGGMPLSDLSEEERATAVAERGGAQMPERINDILLDPLIELLEERAG